MIGLEHQEEARFNSLEGPAGSTSPPTQAAAVMMLD
jgi:hypothetical protein